MQFIDFPNFLSSRYCSCAHTYFSQSSLEQYPDVPRVLLSTWENLISMDTCPGYVRLEYDEPKLTRSSIINQINYETTKIKCKIRDVKNDDFPWLKYWFELPFKNDKRNKYMFVDLPLCNIFVGTSEEEFKTFRVDEKEWMKSFGEVKTFFLLIKNGIESWNNGTYFTIGEVNEGGFYDFVLEITHKECPQKLKEIRDKTESYINANWQGFRNSMKRLFGFTGKKADIFIELKKLGDIYVEIGEYDKAMNYYNQLYGELPPEHELFYSVSLMLAITAIINGNSDIDIYDLLKPFIFYNSNGNTISYIQRIECILIVIYYFISINDKYKAKAFLLRCLHLDKKKNLYSFLACPMFSEVLATICRPRKAALYLYRAAEFYRANELYQNSLIAFWKCYRNLNLTRPWTKLQHALLLKIAMLGEVPYELSNQIAQRNLSYVVETVNQLKKIKLTNIIYVNSIVIHDINKEVTGFPNSPPPLKMSNTKWKYLRKKLFPVVYHPSTEEFATSMWTDDTKITSYTIALNSPSQIKFKLTPTNKFGCEMQKIKLFVEPEEMVQSEEIEIVNLRSTIDLKISFTPVKIGSFQIKGIKFMWFGVVPAAVLFHPISYDSVSESPIINITIVDKPKFSYAGIPLRFKARLHAENPTTPLNMHITAESQTANITLLNPNKKCYIQRWGVDDINEEYEFEAIPALTGDMIVHLLLTSMDSNRIARFSYDYFSINCIGVNNPKIIIDIDSIYVDSDFTNITSDCVKFSLNEKTIKIEEPILEYQKNQCYIEISRNLTGTINKTKIEISSIYFKFNDTNLVCETFPSIISFSFEVICLGKNEGMLTIMDSESWCWIGKRNYILKGPNRYQIKGKFLVIQRFVGVLGSLIQVDYPNNNLNLSNTFFIIE